MSEFEDTIIKESSLGSTPMNPRSNNNSNSSEGKKSDTNSKSNSKKKANKSLIDLIMKEGENASTLADKYSLDPELTQKVLVPLLNFLEKYEIGNEVASSPTAQGLGDLASIISDVAPVIRNAASYFEGRATNLSVEDEAFLAKIREAQEGNAGGLFLDDDGSISEFGDSGMSSEISFGESVEDPESQHLAEENIGNSYYDGPIPLGTNPFKDGVDWASVLGADPAFSDRKSVGYTYTDMMPSSDLMVKGLADLAREAGLDPDRVASSDTQSKINGTSYSTDAFSAGVAPNTSENLSEIQSAMKKEQARQASQSTPENITTYDPLNVPGFQSPPVLKTRLESAEEIANRSGIDLNAVETVETFEESESEIVWLTDEEASEQGYEEMDIEDETDDLGLSPFTFDGPSVEQFEEVKKQIEFGEASDDGQE